MALRKIHIEKISSLIVKKLHDLGVLASKEGVAELNIKEILTQNLEAERALDDEAQKLLQQHSRSSNLDIDDQRAFQMIKKELAKKKGFVL